MFNNNIQANIGKLFIIKALRWFLLIMPILILFFQENGLSMKEILILQSVFSIAIIIFEIPSGYFSDVIGRKITIIIATILSFAAFLLYSFAYSFNEFLIAEIIMGFGSSFLSGTDSAMLYDTLAQLKKESLYKKFEGHLVGIGNFSEGIASLLAGFVATISLRTPFFIEAGLMFLSIIVAITLIEPNRRRFKSPEGNIKGIIKIIKFSIYEHKEIKWLIIYSGFITASTLTMVFFIQPYFKLVNLPLIYFGVIWAILNIAVGIFSIYAHKYELKLGRKKALISLIIFPFVSYLLLASTQSLWSLIFILPFYFTRAMNQPILKDYINRLVPSEMRATILSIKNLIGRAIFAIIGPLIGWLTDIYSLQLALMASGIIFFIFATSSIIFLHKHKGL